MDNSKAPEDPIDPKGAETFLDSWEYDSSDDGPDLLQPIS